MKFLQVADLHIGKRLLEQPMGDDQRQVLGQIVSMAIEHQVDALLICGDIYDKNVPSEEAIALFDCFLSDLCAGGIATYIISGNHDSAERLAFGSNIMQNSGIHICTGFDGTLVHHTLSDQYGQVNLYMLPFVKPASVARFFEQRPQTYHEAVTWVLESANIDTTQRNVLMAHQFVTAGGHEPGRSDSEQINTGGLDNVDFSAFANFDYVALGHIHAPQKVGRDTVRYSGSMLPYSFSEQYHNKGCVLVEIEEKGQVSFSHLPLTMPTQMATIQGNLADILQNAQPGDLRYLQVILTDTEPVYNAIGSLKNVYPNVLSLKFAPRVQNAVKSKTAAHNVGGKTSMQLFEELYLMQNDVTLSDAQRELILDVMGEDK